MSRPPRGGEITARRPLRGDSEPASRPRRDGSMWTMSLLSRRRRTFPAPPSGPGRPNTSRGRVSCPHERPLSPPFDHSRGSGANRRSSDLPGTAPRGDAPRSRGTRRTPRPSCRRGTFPARAFDRSPTTTSTDLLAAPRDELLLHASCPLRAMPPMDPPACHPATDTIAPSRGRAHPRPGSCPGGRACRRPAPERARDSLRAPEQRPRRASAGWWSRAGTRRRSLHAPADSANPDRTAQVRSGLFSCPESHDKETRTW